jgi:uncharacterized protein (TIGR02466 family)
MSDNNNCGCGNNNCGCSNELEQPAFLKARGPLETVETILNPTTSIIDLFPTPLYTTMLPESVADVAKFFFDQKMSEGDLVDQYGWHSEDTYILNNDECKHAADIIMEHVEAFGKNVLRHDVEGYSFSQSWVSVKAPGQHHVGHTHPNSIISGVLYFGSPEEKTPAIKFHKSTASMNVSYVQTPVDNSKPGGKYSWEEFQIPFIPGMLLLFPSYLVHSVPTNESEHPRFSLAFNAVTKGNLGHHRSLTELQFGKVL